MAKQQGQQHKIVPITSPVKGINRVVSREQQSPETCWDALNVLPFDAFGRRRVGQRFGTSKLYAGQLESGARIQGMLPISTIIYPATLNSTGIQTYSNSWTPTELALWTQTGGGTWSTDGSGGLVVPIAPYTPQGTTRISRILNIPGEPSAPINPLKMKTTLKWISGFTNASSGQGELKFFFNYANNLLGGTNWFAWSMMFTPNSVTANLRTAAILVYQPLQSVFSVTSPSQWNGSNGLAQGDTFDCTFELNGTGSSWKFLSVVTTHNGTLSTPTNQWQLGTPPMTSLDTLDIFWIPTQPSFAGVGIGVT